MGSGFFKNLVPDYVDWGTRVLTGGQAGAHLNAGGGPLGPNGSSYAGIAPSLAGANAGYGGPIQQGAASNAGQTPLNPYVYAAGNAATKAGS